MLTRSLALAHAVDRIRVNAVCPGPVADTGIMDRNLAAASDPAAALASYVAKAPLAAAWGRLIEPAEVAAADPVPLLRRGRDDHGRDDRGRRRQERRRSRLTAPRAPCRARVGPIGPPSEAAAARAVSTTSPCGWIVSATLRASGERAAPRSAGTGSGRSPSSVRTGSSPPGAHRRAWSGGRSRGRSHRRTASVAGLEVTLRSRRPRRRSRCPRHASRAARSGGA